MKKELTRGGEFGILTELSAGQEPRQRGKRKKYLTASRKCGNLKKLLLVTERPGVKKTLKKVLDKRRAMMYHSNVPPEAACTL